MNIPAEPYALMAWSYYGVSWLLFVFFRYYFLPSYWFLWMQFAVSILYGGGLAILVSLFLLCVKGTNSKCCCVYGDLHDDIDDVVGKG